MKRKILIVCMIVLGLLSLTGCHSGGNETLPVSDEEYMDYAGRQFAGEDPWGGILTVTVRSIVDGKMDKYPEAAFYNVGTMEDVIAKAEKIEKGEL